MPEQKCACDESGRLVAVKTHCERCGELIIPRVRREVAQRVCYLCRPSLIRWETTPAAWHVYRLELAESPAYIGHTNDPLFRLTDHLVKRRVDTMVVYLRFWTKEDAYAAEQYEIQASKLDLSNTLWNAR